MNLLTIMIPSLDSRADKLNRLINELTLQNNTVNQNEVGNIIIDVYLEFQHASIGYRRNTLLGRANSKYVCFFDDDDMPTEHYINKMVAGMLQDVDCCSLKGIYTVNGQNPEIFEHSIKYNIWKTNEGTQYPNVKYERPPNHLNCIKSDIAKQFKFRDISHGEDNDWSDVLRDSKKIQTEYYIEQPIYQYLKTI